MTEENLYVYRAVVVRIYDGDTIRFDIDLGLGVWLRNQSVRLYGIDAPEIRGEERPEGLKSKDFINNVLQNGTEVLIRTHLDKTGKYGRLLATIYKDGEDINALMISSGHAEIYSKK